VLCSACGHTSDLSFGQVRAALRSGRLPLGHERPGFAHAVAQQIGGVADPTDWAAFGLPPDSSLEAIHTKWRELAQTLHPDHGVATSLRSSQ
jgi:hypothetical protein